MRKARFLRSGLGAPWPLAQREALVSRACLHDTEGANIKTLMKAVRSVPSGLRKSPPHTQPLEGLLPKLIANSSQLIFGRVASVGEEHQAAWS